MYYFFFFSSRRRHTRCALVTGVQTCALPIYVEDERGAVARLQQRVAAQHRQPRLLLRADDVEGDAGFAIDALDEFGPVGGAAARLRRDRAGQGDRKSTRLNSSH